MIFYIHGFNSGKGSSTSELLAKQTGKEIISLSYDSSKCCKENIDSLISQFNEYPLGNHVIIGTSLGGFYALKLAEYLGTQAICFNPALFPSEQLEQFIGENVNFSTGEHYVLTKETVASYKDFETPKKMFNDYVQMYVSEKDGLLKYPIETLERYLSQKIPSKDFDVSSKLHCTITQTSHRITDFSPFLKTIELFCSRYDWLF